jgi:hypothetical protein
LRALENGIDLRALDAREPVQKLVDGSATLYVFEERFHGDGGLACTPPIPSSAQARGELRARGIGRVEQLQSTDRLVLDTQEARPLACRSDEEGGTFHRAYRGA